MQPKLTPPVNMSYNCCSGNFSSLSLRGYPHSLRFSRGSSYPRNLVYSTDLCSPSTCQLGSSLYRGGQETCCEPTSSQTSCVVFSPCQTSCYCPRTSTLCSPCHATSSVSLDSGSSGSCSLGYGSRSSYSLDCGSSDFRSLTCGIRGFPFLSHGCQFCCPSSLISRTISSSYYRSPCGSNVYCSSY
ncbi:keratin-associated protein 13-1-like [Pteropus medius]|uniref:keratin-associated protein 13-1-like n=1 Tax=Pteropus vampyrus TaxID=132908 RepID=UPI00196B5527|nr:keratin-associated protein 13-1-like [Pteropus giganteus]